MLRVEVVVHNTKALRCGKALARWPQLRARMPAMPERFLAAVPAAHVAFIDTRRFEAWTEPTQRGQRRLAGLDPKKARNRHVVHAAMALRSKPDGLAVAEPAQTERARTGWNLAHYSRRHAAYELATLRGKNLAAPIVRTRRHEIRPPALRAMSANVILRDAVILPVLAGVQPADAPAPGQLCLIDRHNVSPRAELLSTLRPPGAAARPCDDGQRGVIAATIRAPAAPPPRPAPAPCSRALLPRPATPVRRPPPPVLRLLRFPAASVSPPPPSVSPAAATPGSPPSAALSVPGLRRPANPSAHVIH